MDVTLPNGQVIQGVPEGTSKDVLVAKLETAGHDVSWYKGVSDGAVTDERIDRGGIPDDIQQAPQLDDGQAGGLPVPDTELGDGFPGASVIEPAATMVTGALAEPIAGVAGIVQAVNPFAEQGAGARAVEATREALTYQPKTQEGQEGLQAVGETLAPVGEALKGAEDYLGTETFDATGSPALAAAAATIPTALLEGLGLAAAKGSLRAGARTKASSQAKEVKQALVESAPSIEQLQDTARAVYKEIDDAGVRLRKGAFAGLDNRINKAVKKAGFDQGLNPKAASVLNRFKSELGVDKSLTDIETLRKVAQGAAQALEPADARIGSIIVDNIDQFLDKVSPTAFQRGSVKAADITPKFKVARELWGRARRSELINEAFGKAKNQASGFENGIVTQFRSILNNKKKSRFFKPNEISAMQDVVRGTTAGNIAKVIGRFGFSEGHASNILGGSIGVAGGAAIGGPVGAVAVPLIGQTSRKLAQRLTRGNAEFANTIVKAGTNAEDIAKAYIANTPKGARKSAELSELLMRPDIEIAEALTSTNRMVREAAEIARGRNILLGLSAITAAKETGA